MERWKATLTVNRGTRPWVSVWLPLLLFFLGSLLNAQADKSVETQAPFPPTHTFPSVPHVEPALTASRAVLTKWT